MLLLNQNQVETEEAVHCTHEDYIIERACCTGRDADDCACGGVDSIICTNVNCDGMTDDEVDAILN